MKYPKECKSKAARLAWDSLADIKYGIHKSYGRAYILPEEYNAQMKQLSKLRRLKSISVNHRRGMLCILKHGLNEHYELQEYLYNAPRREAQKFIGKKNIRKFIFKRDGFKRLKCLRVDKLSLDHIKPINKGGLNRLYNLQTLCMPCNSSKGTKIIDYR